MLHVISSDERRGAQVFAVDLHDWHVQHGRPSAVVALSRSGSQRPLPVALVGSGSWGPSAVIGLRRAAVSRDVLIAHGSTALPACAAATAVHRPAFVYRSIGDPRYWSSARAARWRVDFLLRGAGCIVVLWEAAATELRRRGIRADRIAVVPNGVPAARFRPATAQERADARRHVGIDGEGAVLAYVGAISREKNVAALVELAEDVGATLLVAGAATSAGSAVATSERVVYVGATADPRAVLAAADVAVLASATEGLPAALIEAGMMGLPSVTTDVGGVREIVLDGVTGAVVPPGDRRGLAEATARALDAAPEWGAAAHEHCVGRFDLAVVAPQWDGVLASVCP